MEGGPDGRGPRGRDNFEKESNDNLTCYSQKLIEWVFFYNLHIKLTLSGPKGHWLFKLFFAITFF